MISPAKPFRQKNLVCDAKGPYLSYRRSHRVGLCWGRHDFAVRRAASHCAHPLGSGCTKCKKAPFAAHEPFSVTKSSNKERSPFSSILRDGGECCFIGLCTTFSTCRVRLDEGQDLRGELAILRSFCSLLGSFGWYDSHRSNQHHWSARDRRLLAPTV